MIVRLGDYIREYSKRNKSLKDIPVYSVTNSVGLTKPEEYFNKTIHSEDLSNYKIVKKNMIAFNPVNIKIGSVVVQDAEDEVIVSPLYTVFQVDENVFNPYYVVYFLKSNIGLQKVLAKTTGSVRIVLKYSGLCEIEIPLIPLEEQRKIVQQIEKTKQIISLRNNEMEKLSELVKARFVEMFGSQSHNEKGLPYLTIDDVAEIYLGITHTPTYVDDGVMFISAKNTSGDFLDLSDVKYISREEFEGAPKGSKPQKNDVLFSRVGSNLGHPVILEEDLELCTFVSLGFLRTKGKVTSNYLKHWMRDDFFAVQVMEHVKGGGQPNLNTGWLKQFKIIVPEMSAQVEFDEFCKQVDKSKVIENNACRCLKYSLMPGLMAA